MVLVEHQGIKTHLFSVHFLIEIAVIELRTHVGIVHPITDAQIEALRAHQTGRVVLPGLLREMPN